VTDVLSQRGLNRATLARQYLLERAPARAIEAIKHLGGMQSQAPLAPYVGLWTRLQDFAPDELTAGPVFKPARCGGYPQKRHYTLDGCNRPMHLFVRRRSLDAPRVPDRPVRP
jgi:hypothetical protein